MAFRPVFQVFACYITVCFLLCYSEAGDSVPFITWSNQKYLEDIPSQSVGQIVDRDFLLSTCIQKIMENEQNQVVMVFYFNQLSIDDISRYGGAYLQNSEGGSLKNFMHSYQNSASHLTMEMVEPVPLKAIEEKAVGPTIKYTKGWSSELVEDQENVLLIPLELSTDRAVSLQNADNLIKKLIDEVVAMGKKFTAILTASHPSKISASRDQEPLIQTGRHLLQTTDGDINTSYSLVHFNDSNCHGLLYVANIAVAVPGNDAWLNVSNGPWDTATSKCTKNSTTFVMKTTGKEVESFMLTLSSSSSSYFWNFLSSSAKFTVEGKSYDVNFKINTPQTPQKFSFHCGIESFGTKEGGRVNLTNFQVQPFNVNDTLPRFSRANDCVGFFTPGIWMGLVITLILVLILYFGVSMLAGLTVMDQFDDPKGKTITVNVSE